MAKNVWNGVIIGVVAALAIAYIATTLSWLGWLDTMMINISEYFTNLSWWPTTIEFLQNITTVKYIFAGLIGALVGLWIEYR